MHCPHCGREAPDGRFCGSCGAPLTGTVPRDPRRRRAYAANPHEHVYHPGVVTTFFPHLNLQRTHLMRWILLGGAFIIFLLGLARYVPIAFIAAALFVPILYLFYFYDAEIYEGEPLRVLASTFLIGAILGALLNLGMYRTLLSLAYTLPGEAPSQTFLLVSGVIMPVAALALSLVGPLILFFARPRFNEVLDGLAFGVASGLGFAAAQSIVLAWQLITGPLQEPGGDAASWALPTIKTAILLPLLYAAAAGLICAVLWLRRDPLPTRGSLGWLASLPVAVVLAIVAVIVPALGTTLWGNQLTTLLWYGATLVVMILIVRHVLHVGLVEKAHELGHGSTLTCPHCHHPAPDVPFCPTCGMALRSTAKRARRSALVQEGRGE
ncbi:MAG TPA: PrsW family glutamic-type intramembrane protease [Ktedonobacterales bacterium]